jgi:hypothetical protein
MSYADVAQADLSEMIPVFKVVFYLKDEHSLNIDEVYKLHYYTPVNNP